MKSRQVLIIVSACLALQVLLHASPVHAALQSTGILDLATQHFQTSLAKWKPIFTQAALTLFWLLATIACVWELGSIALRGASMEAALSFLLRFAFIEGLWLYIILNAVPIETAIIDSFRKLGSTASGLRQELMPSEVLDLGFALLWKTTKFVAVTGWSAPIVALVALVVTLIIVLIFGLTAANMVLLVISQWFLVYGGIFFLGFGGAPWESDKAKNYLYLGLSIGAQFLGMAAVIGIGQSFIEAQYAQLSDDTALGELVVILLVGGLMFLLTNEIPKLLTRFVPGGYNVNGFGVAAALGGVATAAAALAAAGAMAKGAMEAMGGIAKAASAAKDAAKSQKQPQPPPRSQTGVSSGSSGGSIGPAGGGGSNGAGTRTQGPLGTMLTTTGIGPSQLPNGANRTPAAARAGTSTVAAKSTTAPPKPQANQGTQEGNESAGSRRSAGKPAGSASSSSADSSQPVAASLRARTHANAPSPQTDAHAPSTRAAAETENDERTGTAEAEISSGRRGDCEPLSDEATATGDADVQHDTQNSTSPEPSATHADTSLSSTAATSAAPEGGEDASSMAPAHAAPTGVDGDAEASSAHPSTSTSSSAATSTSTEPTSTPAAASNGTLSSTARSATAEQASAPAAATTSAGTGTQETPPSAANSGASEGGSTQSVAAQKAHPAEAASATPGAGENSSGTSKPASATPASPDSEASTAPGGQRGSTAIGGGSTVLAAAKILGEHTVGHYRARGGHFKEAIMARVDNTTGGQIAQAIRKKYGLHQGSKDPAPVRSATTISDAPGSMSESDPSPSPPPTARRRKHPAHWSSGDDPMTDDQLEILERKLGASFDLNMTKAEAAILIDELIHEE